MVDLMQQIVVVVLGVKMLLDIMEVMVELVDLVDGLVQVVLVVEHPF